LLRGGAPRFFKEKIKTMTTSNFRHSQTMWQNAPDDSVSEPTLLIESYEDVINIQQHDQQIKINYESVDELCRNLKYWAKLRKEGKMK